MRQVSPEVPPRSRAMVSPLPPTPAAGQQEEGFSLTLDDVYHTVFRHKLKIIICAVLGFAASAAWYMRFKPTFITEAKLFVRFVVMDGVPSAKGPSDETIKSPDMRGETIMISEQEIASSFDLLKQVAQVVGPEKILAQFGGGTDINSAAMVIRKGLTVQTNASILGFSFQHPDHELVQPILREVITQYLKKHTETHHSSSIGDDILTQETDSLRSRLTQTEDELRKAKSKAGVVSVDDAKKTYSEQVAKIRQEMFAAEAELAERTANLQELTKGAKKDTETKPDAAAPAPAPEPELPTEVIDAYRSAVTRVELLRGEEQRALVTYTPESDRVKALRAQLADAQAKRQELETANPRLAALLTRSAAPSVAGQPAAAGRPGPDLALEIAHVNSLKAKIKTLSSQMDTLRNESAALGQLEGNIQDLMRKRDLEQTNYLQYAASLERQRINAALGSGKVSNVSVIQTPSTPAIADKNRLKIPGALAAGGLGLGLAWAFLFELFLDQSVRRPVDVEKKLRLPLFLSIPDLERGNSRRRLPWSKKKKHEPLPTAPQTNETSPGTAVAIKETGKGGELGPVSTDVADSLQPFHETLRDRLISFCESHNMTRKPKLIAVTGLGHKSGVTTTAAGLARTLSETGEGNVLLVDLTSGQGSAMQFQKGTVNRGLDELLDSDAKEGQVQQNLYVVTDSNNSDQLSRNLPRRFTKLIPKIKASDFDYVVFDMPPVSQLSITPRLAGFMDVVLFVMESEKTNLDMIKRATALLGQSKAHVGAILNKTHSYVPQRLHQDNLSHF